MTTDTVWKQAVTPTGSGIDAPGWTLGTEIQSHVGGSVTAIWWYPPDNAQGLVKWRIYAGAVGGGGVLLSSGDVGDVGSGYVNQIWNRIPVTATLVGAGIIACLFTSVHGDYSFFNPGYPVDDGILRATQGGFRAGADGVPTDPSILTYAIDVEVTYGTDTGPGGRFLALLGEV